MSFPKTEIFSYSTIRNSFELNFSSVFFEGPRGQISRITGGPRTIVWETPVYGSGFQSVRVTVSQNLCKIWRWRLICLFQPDVTHRYRVMVENVKIFSKPSKGPEILRNAWNANLYWNFVRPSKYSLLGDEKLWAWKEVHGCTVGLIVHICFNK